MRAQPSISFGTNHTSNNVSNADYYGGESNSGFSYRVNILQMVITQDTVLILLRAEI